MNPPALSHRLSLGPGALVSALGLALPAAAQVTPYGSGINPAGSLVITSGVPQVGQTFNVGVSNTATSSAPAALAFLAIASAPDAAFPAGTVLPGFGLSSPASPGELLISLVAPDPLQFLGAVPWAGGTTAPAPFTIIVPSNPALSGVTFFLQGMLVDPTTGPSLGLTNGLAVKLATPGATGPVPCVSEIPGMAIIPQGTFLMGSNAASGPPYFPSSSEKPVHQVTISYCFWMGQTEVTQAQYQALMGANPSFYVGANRPVEGVTWFNAQAYCAALTAQQLALGNVPAGYQYRLPTEAEWEYACRAGTTTEFNVGSELFCSKARFSYSYHSQSSCGATTSSGHVVVGSYPANAWGLHDMHGNVQEWCLDSFSSYTASAKTDPYVSGGPNRVLRGGTWFDISYFCRSAVRYTDTPGFTADSRVGFRVVLAPVLVP
jgi:formylglycine-generating enzyme required for sulfatase activity